MRTAIALTTALLAGCAIEPTRPPPPITEGMDTTTLTTYYGRPARINRDSTGSEQWVFRQTCIVGPIFQDNLYVYVESGHVTGWQQFGCMGR